MIITVSKKIVLLLFSLSSLVVVSSSATTINEEIDSLIKQSKEPMENLGVAVFDLGGEELYSLNGTDGFIPASLSKIFVSIMGASVLQPSFKLRTTLGYVGSIENGELKGDLYLVGGGDPQLYTSHLNNFICALKKRGVNKISGNFYYVDSSLPTATVINGLGDLDQTDNSGVSALSVNYNRFSFYKEDDGSLTEVMDLPGIEFKRVTDNLSEARFEAVEESGNWVWRYRSYKSLAIDELPVRDPSRFTAEMFRQLAAIQNVIIPSPMKKNGFDVDKFNKILWHESYEIIDIIAQMLEFSNNLVAELILLEASKEYLGQKPPFPAGPVLLSFLKERYPSVDWTGVYLDNGSGHSYVTKVTPKAFGKFLQQVHNVNFKDVFFGNLFSISGHNGWIRKRLYKDGFAFTVMAKTGTIDFSSAIAGYFFGKSGQKKAFVIMNTNKKKRESLDALPANDPKRAALKKEVGGWKNVSRNLQDSIIKVLINRF